MTEENPDPARDARARRWLRIRIAFYVSFFVGLFLAVAYALWLPGDSFSGPIPAATDEERALAAALEADVRTLSEEIGERNLLHPEALVAARDWVTQAFEAQGYDVQRERYDVSGDEVENLWVEVEGDARAGEMVVVGAHYDSAPGTPGADDNASGVAVLLALARAFSGRSPARTLRFVAFVNEEPPWFQSEHMGSLVHARALSAQNADVVAMLSLETMAYFRDEADTQRYPFPLSLFFPDTGNFLGFVSDVSSRDLLHRSVATFREDTALPSEGAALPASIPGVDWSDHWSFWQSGYRAIMITDTALFRNPHYHEPTDLPEELDYERLARATLGLTRVVSELARGD